jgi:hypothetical protein
MAGFIFHADLFADRTRVLEALSARELMWLSHFSSVDLVHESHGLEVCGIVRQEDALKIQDILIQLFPGWYPG